jgi:aspartate-semialdehyde dehydrogenase
MSKIPVAILGATGAVGQHFFAILDRHPQFEIAGLYASRARSHLSDVPWVASLPQPEAARHLPVRNFRWKPCGGAAYGQRFAPAGFCGRIRGTAGRAGGIAVFSNASAHRMDPDVPILIPEINAPHIDICPRDRHC